MKAPRAFSIVLVTAPNLKVARALAKAALQARLIACANVVPEIESHYRWQGKVESATEVLLILKTREDRLAALQGLIIERHPYDTPEFLVLPIEGGNDRYLNWLSDCVGRSRTNR